MRRGRGLEFEISPLLLPFVFQFRRLAIKSQTEPSHPLAHVPGVLQVQAPGDPFLPHRRVLAVLEEEDGSFVSDGPKAFSTISRKESVPCIRPRSNRLFRGADSEGTVFHSASISSSWR